MSERSDRLALNEALFRAINQRILVTAEAWDVAAEDEPIEFYCECANPDCVERTAILPKVFERIHADPEQFVVIPGHEVADIERVVSEGDGYVVVRKIGAAGEFVRRLENP